MENDVMEPELEIDAGEPVFEIEEATEDEFNVLACSNYY